MIINDNDFFSKMNSVYYLFIYSNALIGILKLILYYFRYIYIYL